MSFMLLGILNSQVSGGAAGAYELISSTILTSSASSVTFSSIPSDYKHLQIRLTVRSTGTGNPRVLLRYNNDSSVSYAQHVLYGASGTVNSESQTSQSASLLYYVPPTGASAGIFGSAVYDILDYSSTSKNTTTRVLAGAGAYSTLYPVVLSSILWNNTAAVNSILLSGDGQNFEIGSRFSLYGIRG